MSRCSECLQLLLLLVVICSPPLMPAALRRRALRASLLKINAHLNQSSWQILLRGLFAAFWGSIHLLSLLAICAVESPDHQLFSLRIKPQLAILSGCKSQRKCPEAICSCRIPAMSALHGKILSFLWSVDAAMLGNSLLAGAD